MCITDSKLEIVAILTKETDQERQSLVGWFLPSLSIYSCTESRLLIASVSGSLLLLGTFSLRRQVGKKCRLAKLVVTGQQKGVIDCLQQDVPVLQV